MNLKIVLFQKVLVFTFMYLCSSNNEDLLDYPELSKIPEHCKPESCSEVDIDAKKSNLVCDCDEKCSKFGTCCIDSPYRTLIPTNSFTQREQCSEVHASSISVFMVSKCNPRWRGHHVIRQLCERINPSDRDPLAMIPVTNPQTNMTYKNFFCSLCNFNDQSDVVLWNILLSFDFDTPRDVNEADRENIIRRLEYSRNRWGIWNTSYDNSMNFVPVAITAQIPSAVYSVVKTCDITLVSQCARRWKDITVKRLCQSYLSPITLPLGEQSTDNYVKFRNPHCAICNYMTNFEQDIFCGTSFGSVPPNLSFSLLLDVNPSDGNKVGESNTCERNEVYDPFFQKCRALVCALPGYVVENGNCVRT